MKQFGISGRHCRYVEEPLRIVVSEPGIGAQTMHCSGSAGMPAFRVRYAYTSGALVLVRTGFGWANAAGRMTDVRPGTLLWSPPGGVDVFVTAPYQIDVLVIPEPRDAYRDERRPPIALSRQLGAGDALSWNERLDAFMRLADDGAFDEDAERAIFDAFMEPLLVQSGKRREVVGGTLGTLRREAAHIETLDTLASGLGYTRNHLNDLTRDATGASLGTWLSGIRMARARELLIHDDTPIATVGAESGYADPAYFARAFRRFHGVPPIAWRIAHRPDDPRRSLIVAEKEFALEISA